MLSTSLPRIPITIKTRVVMNAQEENNSVLFARAVCCRLAFVMSMFDIYRQYQTSKDFMKTFSFIFDTVSLTMYNAWPCIYESDNIMDLDESTLCLRMG